MDAGIAKDANFIGNTKIARIVEVKGYAKITEDAGIAKDIKSDEDTAVAEDTGIVGNVKFEEDAGNTEVARNFTISIDITGGLRTEERATEWEQEKTILMIFLPNIIESSTTSKEMEIAYFML